MIIVAFVLRQIIYKWLWFPWQSATVCQKVLHLRAQLGAIITMAIVPKRLAIGPYNCGKIYLPPQVHLNQQLLMG